MKKMMSINEWQACMTQAFENKNQETINKLFDSWEMVDRSNKDQIFRSLSYMLFCSIMEVSQGDVTNLDEYQNYQKKLILLLKNEGLINRPAFGSPSILSVPIGVGNAFCVEELIQAGAQLDLPHASGCQSSGVLASLMCTKQPVDKKLTIAKVLLQHGACLHAPSYVGHYKREITPLMIAAFQLQDNDYDLRLFKLFLEHGARFDYSQAKSITTERQLNSGDLCFGAVGKPLTKKSWDSLLTIPAIAEQIAQENIHSAYMWSEGDDSSEVVLTHPVGAANRSM